MNHGIRAQYVACLSYLKNACNILTGKLEAKRPLGRHLYRK
jgi:hypothetical protein